VHNLLDCCGDNCIDFNEKYLSFEPGGIGRHLTFLGVQGLLYFTALLLVESRLLHRLCYMLRHYCSPQVIYIDADEVNFPSEDDDVKDERLRIIETPLDTLLAVNSVIVRELTRTYRGGGNRGDIVAVNRLSFGVRRGECFGLLGTNGAGKTTTFQMLTSDIFPTDGDAYINGISITHDIRQVVIFPLSLNFKYYIGFNVNIIFYVSIKNVSSVLKDYFNLKIAWYTTAAVYLHKYPTGGGMHT